MTNRKAITGVGFYVRSCAFTASVGTAAENCSRELEESLELCFASSNCHLNEAQAMLRPNVSKGKGEPDSAPLFVSGLSQWSLRTTTLGHCRSSLNEYAGYGAADARR